MADLEVRELRVSLDRAKVPVAFEILGGGRPASATFRLANISRSGMFLESNVEPDLLPQGSSIQFALRLDQSDDEVTGVAAVRWVRRKDLGPYRPRGVGVQVIAFHENNAERRYLEFLETCLLNLRITDLMDPAFAQAGLGAPVGDAVRQMNDRGVDSVVVIDGVGAPIGIFTKTDLARICGSPGFLGGAIEAHMTPRPLTLTSEQGIDDAYAILRQGTLRQVPVTEDGVVVGVLSMRDLARYWTEYMDLQAKRLTRNYDRAMSVIAHDLRTPIGLIQTTNQLLTSGEVTPAEYLRSGLPEVLEDSCGMMLGLIDDILDLQRLKVGAIRLERKAVDVEELARKIARAFTPAAASKGIQLKVVVPTAVPRIKADPLRLEQVLNNLVSNALKFSPEGGGVVIGVKPLHSQVAIWVADNGPGIPAAELQALFCEFRPLSNRPTKGEKSTGFGLAITKRLVDAHGGTIDVDSEPGLGTTFTVCLPIGELQ